MDTTTIHVRIDERMKTVLAEQASREQRTLSNLVAKILTDYLAQSSSPPATGNKRKVA